MTRSIEVFRVLRDSDRTRVETNGDVLGWGVRFPCGRCYVDWNRKAYPEGDRLDHPHISEYGSIPDVEQGTGGEYETIHRWEVRV